MYLGAQGIEKVQPMNTGGTIEQSGVLYSMTPAFHSSALVEDGNPVTMGDPAGYVIRADGKSLLSCRRHLPVLGHGADPKALPAENRLPAGG